MGHIKQKSALEHVQNVLIHIILCIGKVSSWHLLATDTFYSIQLKV